MIKKLILTISAIAVTASCIPATSIKSVADQNITAAPVQQVQDVQLSESGDSAYPVSNNNDYKIMGIVEQSSPADDAVQSLVVTTDLSASVSPQQDTSATSAAPPVDTMEAGDVTPVTEDTSGQDTPTSNKTEAPEEESTAPAYPVLGDSGDEVYQLQQRLAELGFLNASPTGYYGTATHGAVEGFQSVNGLTADGKAGTQTQALLFSTNAQSAPVEVKEDTSQSKATEETKEEPKTEPKEDTADSNSSGEKDSSSYQYKYLSSLTVQTGYSGEQLEKAVAGTGLAGLGKTYANAEQTYGVNALFLMAITIHESGWGTSSLAKTQNNIAGLKNSDYTAYRSFDSKAACISYLANHLASNYLSSSGKYYNGATSKGVAQTYCDPSQHWYESIERLMESCYNKIN